MVNALALSTYPQAGSAVLATPSARTPGGRERSGYNPCASLSYRRCVSPSLPLVFQSTSDVEEPIKSPMIGHRSRWLRPIATPQQAAMTSVDCELFPVLTATEIERKTLFGISYHRNDRHAGNATCATVSLSSAERSVVIMV